MGQVIIPIILGVLLTTLSSVSGGRRELSGYYTQGYDEYVNGNSFYQPLPQQAGKGRPRGKISHTSHLPSNPNSKGPGILQNSDYPNFENSYVNEKPGKKGFASSDVGGVLGGADYKETHVASTFPDNASLYGIVSSDTNSPNVKNPSFELLDYENTQNNGVHLQAPSWEYLQHHPESNNYANNKPNVKPSALQKHPEHAQSSSFASPSNLAHQLTPNSVKQSQWKSQEGYGVTVSINTGPQGDLNAFSQFMGALPLILKSLIGNKGPTKGNEYQQTDMSNILPYSAPEKPDNELHNSPDSSSGYIDGIGSSVWNHGNVASESDATHSLNAPENQGINFYDADVYFTNDPGADGSLSPYSVLSDHATPPREDSSIKENPNSGIPSHVQSGRPMSFQPSHNSNKKGRKINATPLTPNSALWGKH